MNKTAKGLIALSGVLVLLGGGYAALRLTEDKGGETEPTSAHLRSPRAARKSSSSVIRLPTVPMWVRTRTLNTALSRQLT